MSSSTLQEDCLDVDKIVGLLKPAGQMSKSLKGFEPRFAQQEMIKTVVEAYNRNGIALIEAGTGTGKSLAYLIPAVLWALICKERTVISTKTINLQEQILTKDLPLIAKALNLQFKAVLVKGMQNYICMRKLEEMRSELLLLNPEEAIEYQKLDQWCYSTEDGSRSSLSFYPSGAMWERVCAENDTCNRAECPYFQDCHFFKARRAAQEAQILVVNHHLLFADLSTRWEEGLNPNLRLLPDYQRLVLDEAHHIEEVATEFFGEHLNYLALLRLLGRLSSEKEGKDLGKLPLLRSKILQHFSSGVIPQSVQSLLLRFNVEFPAVRLELQQYIVELFTALNHFMEAFHEEETQKDVLSPAKEHKLRVLAEHHAHPYWQSDITPRSEALITCLARYIQMLDALESDLSYFKDEKFDESTRGVRYEIKALKLRLEGVTDQLRNFIFKPAPLTKVRWIETQLLKAGINTSITDAELDVAASLAESLFRKFQTIILCSATLTTNQKFSYLKDRIGLTPKYLGQTSALMETIYESPFDYAKQAMLLGLSDLPDPTHPTFIAKAVDHIVKILQISQGNAFILFTSYTMLKECWDKLAPRCKELKVPLFKQGDDNRQALLERFKEQHRSVLMGTDSFWEGVDVAGEALRCVIIVKLPFRVPSEPIVQARTEAISERGGDPFFEYSLPAAIVKFKQGFGRLIRHQRDRGCIVCLDRRLFTKPYGKQFLNSLPTCPQAFLSSEEAYQQMKDLYRRTHHLTKKS